MTRLMSFWNRPMVAAKNAVVAPMNVTKLSATGDNSNKGEQRQTRKTPAVTMVAAWIRADTGVGPSMASGSQVYSGICALLPVAPTKSNKVIIVISEELKLFVLANTLSLIHISEPTRLLSI